MFVKICGLKTSAAVRAAVDSGADAVGFVFSQSPRRVPPDVARSLCEPVPANVVRVAVMRHPSAEEWLAVRDVFEPDWLQTDVADFDDLVVDDAVVRMPVYRDVPGIDADAIADEDRIVFEASKSGIGAKADWGLAGRLAAHTRLMLAGGLDPDNVADAIRTVRPWGVDVSSGVEKSRGIKDPHRIAAFLDAVRGLED